MGCGASRGKRSADHDDDGSEPSTPETEAMARYRRMREARSPGYLTRDPESLNDYKLLLHREGALSSDDDTDGDTPSAFGRSSDVLRKSRDITVVSSRSGSTTSAPRSALRSRRGSKESASALAAMSTSSPACSFLLDASHEMKRVAFGQSTTTTDPNPTMSASSTSGSPRLLFQMGQPQPTMPTLNLIPLQPALAPGSPPASEEQTPHPHAVADCSIDVA